MQPKNVVSIFLYKTENKFFVTKKKRVLRKKNLFKEYIFLFYNHEILIPSEFKEIIFNECLTE